MNKEQAVQVLKQVLANTRATVQEHNIYAQALSILIGLEVPQNVRAMPKEKAAEAVTKN